jgi:glycosyltransferase involved in cell wall biosynthesis
MPSRWEGMSLAMLEAMATGLSVVASDVGGVAETVGRGAGTVVPVGDHFSLAEAIVRRLLSKDLRDREGAAGRRLVLANHTLADSVRQLMKLYEDVVSSRRIPVTGVRADER